MPAFWHPLRTAVQQTVIQASGAALGLCGIVLVWSGVLHGLAVERAQRLNGAVQNTTNLARAFEENIIRSVNAIDQTLLFLREAYERDPPHFDIAAYTRSTQALTDMTFQISLIDRNGMLIGSNLAPGGGRVDLSDREHFRVHLTSPDDRLFISKPVLGRVSQKWSIQITRKLLAADGSFDGVIVVSLDPVYFSRFYQAVDLGPHGAAVLSGTDGVIRARSSSGSDEPPGLGQSGVLLAHFGQQPQGLYTSASAVDGVRRIVAYRGVRAYPLIVSVRVAEQDVLAPYYSNRVSALAVAAALTVLLVAVSALIMVRQRRLQRARAALRVSEAAFAQKSALLETTLEHMSQGIMMIDPQRRVLVCNHRAMDLLGLPPDLLAGQPAFDDVLHVQWQRGDFADDGASGDDGTELLARAACLNDALQVYERPAHNGVMLEIRSTPLPAGGVVRTFTDVTESRRNEAVLRAARDEADQAARAKSEFLATMSHEIRSPMSGMMGVLDLLSHTALDPDQTRMAHMVQTSASDLLAVVNDILDFSKIEAGALSVRLEPVLLRELVEQVLQPHLLAAAAKGVDLRLIVRPDVPAHAEVDPLRLRQILNNLLSNAVKFTAAGEIRLDVGITAAAVPMLRFTVDDTGIGMRDEVLSRLFEPFTQGDGSTTRIYGGTGLGLCISRRLARLLDGDLTVTSQLGKGSVFAVLLPLIVATGQARSAPVRGAPSDFTGDGRRVLVVDDDPTNRWVTQRQLQRLGFEVATADDGETALQSVHDAPFDLMITDCHMPRMDGVALTRAVRASAHLQALPIIGLTADVTSKQRLRCQEAGMTDVAIKPMTLDRLRRLLAGQLPPTLPRAPRVAPPAPHFDPTTYNDLFEEGDPEGAAWLADFLVAAAELMQRLRHHHLTADPVALAPTAHRLAGAALSVGAIRFGEAARALEYAEEAAVEGRMAELEVAFDKAREALRF